MIMLMTIVMDHLMAIVIVMEIIVMKAMKVMKVMKDMTMIMKKNYHQKKKELLH